MGANEKYEAAMHGAEYTPTTAVARGTYEVAWDAVTDPADRKEVRRQARAEFNRWLEAVRAEAKAEALRDLAGTGLESKKISKFQAAWIRGLAREFTQGPHKIVGAFATPETNKENTP